MAGLVAVNGLKLGREISDEAVLAFTEFEYP